MIVIAGVRYEYVAAMWCSRLTSAGGCGHALDGGELCGYAAYVAAVKRAHGQLVTANRCARGAIGDYVGSCVDDGSRDTGRSGFTRLVLGCGNYGAQCKCGGACGESSGFSGTCGRGVCLDGRSFGDGGDVFVAGSGHQFDGNVGCVNVGDSGTSPGLSFNEGSVDNANGGSDVVDNTRCGVGTVGGTTTRVEVKVSGKHCARNRRRKLRAQAHAKKLKEVEISLSEEESALRESVKRKWRIKNELEIAKARQELDVLKGVDVADVVRKRNMINRAAIERNIVAIEKHHSSLRDKDCHSSDDETRVATILAGVKSETISPDSSASSRDLQKAMLEVREKTAVIEKLTKTLRSVGIDAAGIEDVDKSEWTVDNSGMVTKEHQLKFSEYGYNWTTGYYQPRVCEDGKSRIKVDFFD